MKTGKILGLGLALLAGVCALLMARGGSQSSVQDLSPLKRYEQAVRITVGRESNPGGQFAAGQNSENNGWTQLLKEVLNIEIDVRNGFEAAGGDYDQVLALRIAANTLPDTFGINESARGQAMFRQLVEGRRLTDLTNIYPAAVGGLSKEYLNTLNMSEQLQHMTSNGRVYGIAAEREGYNTALLWIRKDWLDICRLQVPKTLDDVKNTALEFVRRRPGGQANTIGIAVNPDINAGIFGQWLGILPVFNAVGSYPDIWIRTADGRIEHGAIQSETRTALGILADWVRDGVLDRNMITMKNGDEVRDTYISTNACGMIFNAWWDPWVQWDGYAGASVKDNQGAEWIPVMAPLNAQGRFVPKNERIMPGGQLISASAKNPEAVVKAMNLLEEIETFRNPAYESFRQRYIVPIEGTTEFRTNSPFRMRMLVVQGRILTAEAINDYKATGRLVIPPVIAGNADYIRGAYDWVNNNTMGNWYRNRNEVEIERYMFQYVGHGAFDLVGSLYRDSERSGVYREQLMGFTGVTASDADYRAMLDDLRNTAFMQIISGVRPLTYFDEFVTQWRRLGGDIITAEVNAAAGGR